MSDSETRHDDDAVLGGVGAVVFESSLDGLLVVECADGKIIKANGAAERLLGYGAGRLVGRPYSVLFPDSSGPPALDMTEDIQFHDQVLKQSFQRADGRVLKLDLTAVMFSADGRDCILATLRDTSERDEYERQIADAARLDSLTGLYSRSELLRRLELEHHRALRYGVSYSVCFIDIDHYKSVNDNYGHMVGDAVLKAFARVVRSELRVNDFAGRYGGDEVVLVLPHTVSSDAFNVVERIRKRVDAARLNTGQSVIEVTASFGLASAFPGQGSVAQVLDWADQALYEAKSLGRNRTCIHEDRRLRPVAGAATGGAEGSQ